MQKTLLFILSLLFIAIIIVLLIPVNTQVTVNIKAPYFNSYQQLMVAQNWRKWNPAIRDYSGDSSLCKLNVDKQGFELAVPAESFIVKHINNNTLFIREKFPDDTSGYSFTIMPGKDFLLTTIIVTFKTSILKSLLPSLREHEINNTGINDFKGFMEDVKQYYGFNIKKVFLNEKKIIVKRKNIPAKDIYKTAAAMQADLHNYIITRHLIQQGPVMVQYILKQGDSLQMLIGIPVNTQVAAGNGFLYMYMPPTKALVANFNGKYGDKKAIYTAMENYIQDKYQRVKIAPYEMFLNKLPVGNNDVVDLQLNCPIF
jgi:hypothetical protein